MWEEVLISWTDPIRGAPGPYGEAGELRTSESVLDLMSLYTYVVAYLNKEMAMQLCIYTLNLGDYCGAKKPPINSSSHEDSIR